MSLYDVEVFCLGGQSICDALAQSVKAGGNPFNFTPPYNFGAKYKLKNAMEFQATVGAAANSIAKELLCVSGQG